jgi:hypothetical protein
MARPVYLCAAGSPHVVDVELFRLGLHREPPDLQARLQERIDGSAGQGYDAVLLAYGLCGKAAEGLTAHDVPLVIPRAHDCITLFLGSRERYKDQFERCPGTYWYVLDYVERAGSLGTTLSLGSDGNTDPQSVYQEYVEKYGREKADYLMEVMGAWRTHYQRAAFIDMGVGESAAVEAETQNEATQRGWTFERMPGDLALIRRLLSGDWERDFLVLQPGQQIRMAYDDDVVRAQVLSRAEGQIAGTTARCLSGE